MKCRWCGTRSNGGTYCSEGCAKEAHEQAHPIPLEMWGDCDICAEKVQQEEESHAKTA
jgi:hypothetical protein